MNWNTVDLLDDCLHSIVQATPPGLSHQIVLVDNASADGSADYVARRWPAVQLITNSENVGFCRANNQAIRATNSPWVLLVNTDARLEPGGVAALLAPFSRDPAVAVVGPRLVYADGSFQRWTAGQAFTLRTVARFLLGVDRFGSAPHGASIYLAKDTRQAFAPAWVSSAVMALRREAIDEVGLLDENIFVYMDDVDLCHRLRQRGWRVWYAAETTAVHFMGSSSRQVTGRSSPEALRALNRWFVRRHGATAGRKLRAIEVIGFGLRVGVHGLRAAVGRSPGARTSLDNHLTNLRVAMEPIRA